MGKHTAANDATVHPLVADALSRRTGAPVAAHGEERPPGESSNPGWPGPPPQKDGGLGWPADPGPERDDVPGSDGAESVDRVVLPRRGWRRLFGASPAA